MGGWIALELARRGRARSVVAIAPAGFGSRFENARSRVTLLAARAFARAVEPLASKWPGFAGIRTALYWPFASRPWKVAPQDFAYGTTALANCGGFRSTLTWLFSHSAGPLDPGGTPVTVLWGTRDRILSPRGATRAQAALAGSDLKLLPGLGHVPMSDDPDLLADAILAVTASRKPQGATT